MSTERLLESVRHDYEEKSSLKSLTSEHRKQQSRRWFLLGTCGLIAHLAIFSLYTLFYVRALNDLRAKYENGPDLTFSPAASAVRLERKLLDFDVHTQTIYNGEPSPELDEAWDHLFDYNNIRVSKEELDRMNRTSVQLSDGSGDYLAALDVMHHIHCLKMVRHYIHPEYYEMPDSQKINTEEHIDHCLDAIRQELICRAEVTFTTYEWLPDLKIPWAKLAYDHTCANWDAIQDWAESRAVDIFHPEMLTHPTLGTVYPHPAEP